ncbi:MAG: hypothetical protein M3Y21_12135, partial [Candidatus Eremiobacteraeota bacterium]|nr:hypothetical protein [Candidatus Eremiobacteraeota bacterium]
MFANWNELFAKMAAAIGLDYFGVDCTLLEDGRVLIFEAGPAMLVHCRETDGAFDYKYRSVPRIFDAFEDLIENRALQLAVTVKHKGDFEDQ